MTSRSVGPAPDRFRGPEGWRWGTYTSAPAVVDVGEARPTGGRPGEHLLLKEWQAVEVGTPEFTVLLAAYDAKLASVGKVVVRDHADDRLIAHLETARPGRVEIGAGLGNSLTRFSGRRVLAECRNEGSRVLVRAAAAASRSEPDVDLEVSIPLDTEPIVICQPFDDDRPLYSHKSLSAATGSISIAGAETQIDPASSWAIVDDHKGWYPFDLTYDWCTFAGWVDGRLVGANLTDNQIRDHAAFNENCWWDDGRMFPLGPIRLISVGTQSDGVERWRFGDQAGDVDVEVVQRHANDVGLSRRPRYESRYGEASGRIRRTDGEIVSFHRLHAISERRRGL